MDSGFPVARSSAKMPRRKSSNALGSHKARPVADDRELHHAPAEDTGSIQHIRSMLRSRLVITNVDQQRFPQGYETDDGTIASNRYILILAGRMDYRVEGIVTRLSAGNLILVPAWVRRYWCVPDSAGCESIWCEFSSFAMENRHHSLFQAKDVNLQWEKGSLNRLHHLWKCTGRTPSWIPEYGHSFATEQNETELDLVLEGELKATLSRFWMSAERQINTSSSNSLHPQVEKSVALIDAFHYRRDTLELLFSKIDISKNHLRLLFREQMQSSPREYLNAVRMRRARHLIHHTDKPIKSIAFETGFNDPLHFSKQYRLYWGHSPREDKRKSQIE